MIFQIIFSSLLVPYTQNKARSFLRSSDIDMLPSLIKEKKFIDTVEKLTIFVDQINESGELGSVVNLRGVYGKSGFFGVLVLIKLLLLIKLLKFLSYLQYSRFYFLHF